MVNVTRLILKQLELSYIFIEIATIFDELVQIIFIMTTPQTTI